MNKKFVTGFHVFTTKSWVILVVTYDNGTAVERNYYPIGETVNPRLVVDCIAAINKMRPTTPGTVTQAALPPYPNW